MGPVCQSLCLTSVALALASCAHPHGGQPQPRRPDTPDYCQISATAIRAVIKPQAQEPNALDAGCVREYASVGGQIYVDARFTKAGALERVPQSSCTAGEFLIRFDSEHNPQSPAPGVVFLSVDEPTPTGRPFSVTVEESRWAKRPSNVLAMPLCDPAFGILSGGESGWIAKLVPPPRGPDDL